MNHYKIVSDSSSNLFEISSINYDSVPLKINAGSKEYIDEKGLDTGEMIRGLLKEAGGSCTSCPSIGEWMDSFEGGDRIFAVTISSAVSGSNNAASVAAELYIEAHPEAKIHVIDSLSTGPEMALIIEKLVEYIRRGMTYEEIIDSIAGYMENTHLLFCLEHTDNLVKNGRVSAAAARIASMLGIRILGQAGKEGTIDPIQKCRGEKQTIHAILNKMKSLHFKGGRVRIDHCLNPVAALKLKDMIVNEFRNAVVEINPTGGLCSYYAEQGGLMIGFES